MARTGRKRHKQPRKTKAQELEDWNLVSEALEPLRKWFKQVPYFDLRPDEVYWSFTKGPSFTFDSSALDLAAREIRSAQRRYAAGVTKALSSTLYFLRHLDIDSIRDAAFCAAKKAEQDIIDSDAAWRYFCGICHRRIKDQQAFSDVPETSRAAPPKSATTEALH
jgi:hypothetical protein